MNYLAIPGLKYAVRVKRPRTSEDEVFNAVCDYFNLTRKTITSVTRKTHIVNARKACQFLLRTECGYTVTRIGAVFGQDHTTVVHALQKVRNFIDTSDPLAKEINEIKYRYL